MRRVSASTCFGLVVLASCIPLLPVSYSQLDLEPSHLSHDKILGIEPIPLAVGITIIGLFLRITMGMAKNKTPFDSRAVYQSSIMSFFGSIPIVATGLYHIPTDTNDLGLFVLLVGLLASVIGVDAGVKGVQSKIKERVNNDVPP